MTTAATATPPTTTTRLSKLSRRLQDAGVFYFPRFLNSDRFQKGHGVPTLQQVLNAARRVVHEAGGLYRPRMHDGAKFNYEMTCAGVVGWLASPDPKECIEPVQIGYYYSRTNPYTGRAFPPIPEPIRRASLIAAELSNWPNFLPHSTLLNFYRNQQERLGIHQDRTERNLLAPVVSLSIGDTGLFQVGGLKKTDPLEDIYLESGDCIVLSGESRLFFHKFSKLLPRTSGDLAHGGRLNITTRQVF